MPIVPLATLEERCATYHTLSLELRSVYPFKEFCEAYYKYNPRGGNNMSTYNKELKNIVGKISLPYFDGSNKCSSSSWIQKLDKYFQLNPMDET